MKPLTAFKNRETIKRFARFLIVGVVNTLVGYGLYAGLIMASVEPQPALFVSFFLGVLWNYVTTARFVFQVSGFGHLPQYVLCYSGIYALNAVVLHLLLKHGVSSLVAQALLTPIVAVLTFVVISGVMRPKSS